MVQSGDGLLVPGAAGLSTGQEVSQQPPRPAIFTAPSSFILTKVHKEFSELMFTRREGRMLEQLTVRDYDFGSSLPLFSRAGIDPPSLAGEPSLQVLQLSCSRGSAVTWAS